MKDEDMLGNAGDTFPQLDKLLRVGQAKPYIQHLREDSRCTLEDCQDRLPIGTDIESVSKKYML